MELSKRLSAVAGLVTEGASVADIGTDHGYIPIYLIRNKKIRKALAMDINEGPLERAREHIREEGLEHQIEIRLSDGLLKMAPGEADTVIAAGMGGGLILKILSACPEVTKSVKEFILQPQSEIARVRRFLNEAEFTIAAEDMVEEDGKFYPMMKLVHGREEKLKEQECRYGRLLLKSKNPVLFKYLENEKGRKLTIWRSLKDMEGERAAGRMKELEEDLKWIEAALSVY